MLRNLILSGGVAHDFAATSPMLAAILEAAGFETRIVEEPAAVTALDAEDYDLLTLNCVWWTCDQTPEWRDPWSRTLPDDARRAVLSHLGRAGGLLALHAATICFDDWPEFARVLGARWEWGRSSHAPCQEHAMWIGPAAHPITEGLSDFAIVDELYTHPVLVQPVEPLITAEWDGTRHPILWARLHGAARICYNALGHGPEAFEHPTNRTLLRRAALWCTGRLPGDGAAPPPPAPPR